MSASRRPDLRRGCTFSSIIPPVWDNVKELASVRFWATFILWYLVSGAIMIGGFMLADCSWYAGYPLSMIGMALLVVPIIKFIFLLEDESTPEAPASRRKE